MQYEPKSNKIGLNVLLEVINTELLDPQWGQSCDGVNDLRENEQPRMIAEKIALTIRSAICSEG
jgi:hypothetical protein